MQIVYELDDAMMLHVGINLNCRVLVLCQRLKSCIMKGNIKGR